MARLSEQEAEFIADVLIEAKWLNRALRSARHTHDADLIKEAMGRTQSLIKKIEDCKSTIAEVVVMKDSLHFLHEGYSRLSEFLPSSLH